MWNLIKECYELLKLKEVEEDFDGKDHYVPGETTLLSFDNLPTVKNILHKELKDLLNKGHDMVIMGKGDGAHYMPLDKNTIKNLTKVK